MKIDTSTWKTFYLHELFDTGMGNGFDRNKMSDDNPIVNYVTRTAENNGVGDVIDYVAGVEPYPAGSITLALGGSIGSTFIQASPFYTGQNVAVLRDKNNLSYETKLFIVSIIKKECSVRFCAFGRELNVHYKTDFTLSLPATPGGKPDWQWMEDYIKSLHSEPITTGCNNPKSLDSASWGDFQVKELFDVKYGINMELNACVETTKDDPEAIAFVARTSENNGVSAFVKPKEGKTPQPAYTITVAGGGSVLSTFLQIRPFYSGRDLYLLIPKHEISNYAKLFIVTVLQAEKYRFNYGRQANKTLPDLNLHLPTTSDGKPDWQFMEDYMRSLPYGDRIA